MALGLVPESDASALQSIEPVPDKSSSAVALYSGSERRGGRMLAHHGSIGSLSVGVPKAKEKADAKAREEQARALVRRLADEKKKREQQIKLKREEDQLRIVEDSRMMLEQDQERKAK